MARLDTAGAPAWMHMWYVDVESNQVVVLADPPALAIATRFVEATGVDPAAVRVVSSPERPAKYHDLRGGDKFDGRSLPLPPYGTCSVGFSVRHVVPNGPDPAGFVTAGHCPHAGLWGFPDGGGPVALGESRESVYPGHDRAWHELNSNWTARPWVNRYGGPTYFVHGQQVAPIGAPVCRSGYASGWKCGTIQARPVTVNFGDGPVSGLTRTNACATFGDSGGPFIAPQSTGAQAQGTLSGGTGSCPTSGMTVFEPLVPVLDDFDLTLVTTQQPQIINLLCEPAATFKFSCDLVYASPLSTQIEWTVNGTPMPSWNNLAHVIGGCGNGQTIGVSVRVTNPAGTVTKGTSVTCGDPQ